MRKNLYVFASLLLFTFSHSQIINFPDINFKTQLLSAQAGNGTAFYNGTSIKIDSNNNNEIEVSEALMVHTLDLFNSGISDLTGLEYFTNLQQLNCAYNSISTLNLSPFPNLVGFNAHNNSIAQLTVSNLNYLTNFTCNNNAMTSLIVSNLPSLHTLHCGQNLLTQLDVSSLPNLRNLHCNDNQISALDLSNQPLLRLINCYNNLLVTLNLRNTSSELANSVDFSNNSTLRYVCGDDFQVLMLQDKITQYGYSNCYVNALCSYIPTESFATLQGAIQFDEANDGCDASDLAYPDLSIAFSNGTTATTIYCSTNGQLNYAVQNGTYTLQPQLANPSYFTITPTSVSVNFPSQGSSFTQNFCVTPNGVHPDLKIQFINLNGYNTVLPGFTRTYKIIYTNQGNQTQSGIVTLNYNDNIMDFVNATPAISSQSANALHWSFTDLKPFESRIILVDLQLNTPMSSPPVNEGDLITYTTTIQTPAIDDTPTDNTFTLNLTASFIELGTPEVAAIDKRIVVYPNPTTSNLSIAIPATMQVESIKIYNSLGQLIRQLTSNETLLTLDVSTLPVGMYSIVFQTNYGVLDRKFMKK